MSQEKPKSAIPGGLFLLIDLAALSVLGRFTFEALQHGDASAAVFAGALELALFVCLWGFFVVQPNEARVLQLFGRYIGTVRAPGLRWANPFYSKQTVSLRAMSFQSEHLKVNDSDGNPIQIAAIIVYRVVDTAKAAFDVDNVGRYVPIQAEAAVRRIAQSYPYDSHDAAGAPAGSTNELSLRGSTQAIAAHLKREVQGLVAPAGVEVLDAQISHLAYAPEIAHAMLQRQQASAIIAARQKIVDGAVGMVEMALERLQRDGVVQLDNERKAQMIANLLVVLCGQREAQPVVNTGTIYQ
jgi:regulator of protease activity HflC (stomatin/prohibitin superfamily)